jgi:hypothetical protein
MKLYVDDIRPVPAGWALARTVAEAVAALDAGGVEEVSLDFMIGDRFQDNFAPVARHIAAMPAEKRPRRVTLHTSSAEGARLLRQILEGAVEVVRPRFHA